MALKHYVDDREVSAGDKSYARSVIDTDLRATHNEFYGFIFAPDKGMAGQNVDSEANDFYLMVFAFMPQKDGTLKVEDVSKAISDLLGWTYAPFRSMRDILLPYTSQTMPDPMNKWGLLVGGYSALSLASMGYGSAYLAARDDAHGIVWAHLSHFIYGETGKIKLTLLA